MPKPHAALSTRWSSPGVHVRYCLERVRAYPGSGLAFSVSHLSVYVHRVRQQQHGRDRATLGRGDGVDSRQHKEDARGRGSVRRRRVAADRGCTVFRAVRVSPAGGRFRGDVHRHESGRWRSRADQRGAQLGVDRASPVAVDTAVAETGRYRSHPDGHRHRARRNRPRAGADAPPALLRDGAHAGLFERQHPNRRFTSSRARRCRGCRARWRWSAGRRPRASVGHDVSRPLRRVRDTPGRTG